MNYNEMADLLEPEVSMTVAQRMTISAELRRLHNLGMSPEIYPVWVIGRSEIVERLCDISDSPYESEEWSLIEKSVDNDFLKEVREIIRSTFDNADLDQWELREFLKEHVLNIQKQLTDKGEYDE